MAIAPAQQYCLHQDDDEKQQLIMSLREELLVEKDAAAAEDRDLEEDLKALRASVAAALQDQDVDDDILPPESWEWAEGVEAAARDMAEAMAEEAGDIHLALSVVLSSSPKLGGEEDAAFVAALLTQAVRVGTRRANAEEVATATRRLMETDLRRLAAAAGTDSSFVSMTPGRHLDPAVPAQVEMDGVAVALRDRLEEWTASLAARLSRGLAEFADRPGEEAFVAAMQMEAARADAYLLSLRRRRAAAATATAAAAA